MSLPPKCFCGFLVFALSVSCLATPLQESFTISDNVNLVVLDASVKDKRGGFVTGLSKEDFKVFDQGRPQHIAQFDKADTPVTVGLVVDNSGSMRSKKPEVVLAGLEFARESNPRDEFFVVNFNNRVSFGLGPSVPFTDDVQALRQGLFYGQPIGQTALYDAIASALGHLEKGHHDKRTLIVVSDGGDNVSKISQPALLHMIEASRATIYTVGLIDPENHDLNPAVLRRFAQVTGGEYFQPATLDQVVPVFEKISRDIRNRYTIGFSPGDLADKSKVNRSLKVIAQHDGRRFLVRTRSSYSLEPALDNAAR